MSTPGIRAAFTRGRPGGDQERTCGATLSRSFAHDMWHIAELNEALGRAGLEQIDLWS